MDVAGAVFDSIFNNISHSINNCLMLLKVMVDVLDMLIHCDCFVVSLLFSVFCYVSGKCLNCESFGRVSAPEPL